MAACTSTTWQLHTQLQNEMAIQHPIQNKKMCLITKVSVLKMTSTQYLSVNHVLVHDRVKNTSTALYVRLDLHNRKHVTLVTYNTKGDLDNGKFICCIRWTGKVLGANPIQVFMSGDLGGKQSHAFPQKTIKMN